MLKTGIWYTLVEPRQHHGYPWRPGAMCYQPISRHGIDNEWSKGLGIYIYYIILMYKNILWTDMFVFTKTVSCDKFLGLCLHSAVHHHSNSSVTDKNTKGRVQERIILSNVFNYSFSAIKLSFKCWINAKITPRHYAICKKIYFIFINCRRAYKQKINPA